VLISPTPVVGPDRVGNKSDNHANKAFSYEGDMLREFIAKQKNMVTVCGDRHWQYVSEHAKTGVFEFSCGPGSNAHAGGWSNDKKLPEHIYLNVVGGFLEGAVSQVDGNPTLVFRHYNPDGEILNEHVVEWD
jgi:alkaline phosphatase D